MTSEQKLVLMREASLGPGPWKHHLEKGASEGTWVRHPWCLLQILKLLWAQVKDIADGGVGNGMQKAKCSAS